MVPYQVHRKKTSSKPQIRPHKEISPPAQTRKSVSTARLFDRIKPTTNGIHKSKSGKTVKLNLGKSILTKRLVSPPLPPPARPKTHPLLVDFNATLSTYRNDTTAASNSALQPVHDKLIQRLSLGTSAPSATANNPNDSSTLSLTAQLSRALALSAIISKPFTAEEIKVRVRDLNGAPKITYMPLGRTVPEFEKRSRKIAAELEKSWQEWEDVRGEIAALGAELLGDEQFPAEFGFETIVRESGVVPAPVLVERREDAGVKVMDRIAQLREEVRRGCDTARRGFEELADEDAKTKKAKVNQWFDLLKNQL